MVKSSEILRITGLLIFLLNPRVCPADDPTCPSDKNVVAPPSLGTSVSAICAKGTRDNFNENVAGSMQEAGGFDLGFVVYDQSMSPDLQVREIAIDSARTQVANSLVGFGKSPDVDSLFDHGSAQTPTYPADLASKISATYSSIDPNDSAIGAFRTFGPEVCGVIGNRGCKKAFSNVVNWMDPRFTSSQGSVGWVTMPELITELGSDPEYSKGASLLAKRLIEKYQQVKAGTLTDPGDLFQDAVGAFRDSGAPQKKAEDMAWDYLTLYSTRGAHMIYSFSTPDNIQVFASLGMVATIISYLDSKSLQNGKTYSLPPNVKTNCDYTRAYHFWLAAGLARKLQQKGYSPSVIFDAIHAEETSYESFSGKGQLDTDPTKIPLHDGYAVETQKNIAFSDAGAVWELQKKPLSPDAAFINVDPSIRQMYDSATLDGNAESAGLKILSGVLSAAAKTVHDAPVSNLDLKSLSQWKALIEPDADVPAMKALLPK